MRSEKAPVPLPLRDDAMRRWQSVNQEAGSQSVNQEAGSQTLNCYSLGLGLLASRTVSNKFLLFISHLVVFCYSSPKGL